MKMFVFDYKLKVLTEIGGNKSTADETNRENMKIIHENVECNHNIFFYQNNL